MNYLKREGDAIVETLSMAEARDRLTELPEQLVVEGHPHAVTVTDRGKPVLAVLPWELFESLVETLEILGADEQMRRVRRGSGEIARGETADWTAVKARLRLG